MKFIFNIVRNLCLRTITKIPMEELKVENEVLKNKIKELELLVDKSKKAEKTRKFKKRTLDFTKYKMRHIALKFCYLGWNYSGLQIQVNVENTIMEEVVKALEKCQLIENRDSPFVVCGRTDKGVSAFQQVLSLTVRSNLKSAKGIIEESGVNIDQRKDGCDREIDYVLLLNKVLPDSIRMLAWSPVDLEFSARFSCLERSYKYFFPRSNLNIDLMREAGSKLIGEHDFRNFCTMTVKNGLVEYVRSIYDLTIDPFDKSETESQGRMYVINIRASSFIYHQIRCIVAVLLMVGHQQEAVDIIDHLLDIDGVGGLGKPQYCMAWDLPLVFYDSSHTDVDWQSSPEAVNSYLWHLQNLWVTLETKQSILKLFLNEIVEKHQSVIQQRPLVNTVVKDIRSVTNWKPLLKRAKEMTLDERIDNFNKKMKILCDDE